MKISGFAIDYGTTNSVIAAYSNESDEMIFAKARTPQSEMSDSYLLPSFFYFDRTEQKKPGWTALELFSNQATANHQCNFCDRTDFFDDGIFASRLSCKWQRRSEGCFDARLVSSVKLELANRKPLVTHSWGLDFSVEDFVSGTFQGLIENMRYSLEKRGIDSSGVKRVILGHPVVFPGEEGVEDDSLSLKAKEILRRSAEKFGLDEVFFIDEAQAASHALSLPQGRSLIVDFGAGTLDVAGVERRGNSTQVLATHGAVLGGNDIDYAIFDRLLAERMGLGSTHLGTLPKGIGVRTATMLKTLRGYVRALHDRDVQGEVRMQKDVPGNESLYEAHALLSSGSGVDVYRSIQKAKAVLQQDVRTEIRYQLPGLVETRIPFQVSTLNEIVNEVMSTAWKPIQATLEDCSWSETDVQFLLMTGGSSQLQQFRHNLSSSFPSAEVLQSDPFLTVAQGLAEFGREVIK